MSPTSYPPQLTLLEKLDLVPAQLSLVAAGIYAALTGILRGKNGAKSYGKHIGYAVVRQTLARISTRQNQYVRTLSRWQESDLAVVRTCKWLTGR